METGIVGRVPNGPSTQNNHVIWVRCNGDETRSGDYPCRHDLSGSSLENVTYKDLSTSGDSVSGRNSNSHEADFKPGAKAGEELPEAWKKKAAIDQEFLLKHGLWSVGSQGHVDGLCKPCHFSHAPKGCKSGFNCNFCHLPHVRYSNGNRPSRDRRAKCKELWDSIHELYGGSMDEASDLLREVASQSFYMQRIITNGDKDEPEQGQRPAVTEAHDPVDNRGNAKMMRAEAARNLVKNIRRTAPAAFSAAANNGAASVSDAQERWSNLVSL